MALRTATLISHRHLLLPQQLLTPHVMSMGDHSSAHPTHPSLTSCLPQEGPCLEKSSEWREQGSRSPHARMASGLTTGPTSDSPGLQGCARATTQSQAPASHLQMWSASRTERGHYCLLRGKSCCPSAVSIPSHQSDTRPTGGIACACPPPSQSKVTLLIHWGTETIMEGKDQPRGQDALRWL